MKKLTIIFLSIIIFSCSNKSDRKIPVIGFLDLLQDETLAQAKDGFYNALKESGFDEKNKTIEQKKRMRRTDHDAKRKEHEQTKNKGREDHDIQREKQIE